MRSHSSVNGVGVWMNEGVVEERLEVARVLRGVEVVEDLEGERSGGGRGVGWLRVETIVEVMMQLT